MKAVKENRSYQIELHEKEAYLVQGYDIKDDNGDIIEHSHTAVVKYAEHKRVLDELEEMRAKYAAAKEEIRSLKESKPGKETKKEAKTE